MVLFDLFNTGHKHISNLEDTVLKYLFILKSHILSKGIFTAKVDLHVWVETHRHTIKFLVMTMRSERKTNEREPLISSNRFAGITLNFSPK